MADKPPMTWVDLRINRAILVAVIVLAAVLMVCVSAIVAAMAVFVVEWNAQR